MIGVDIIEISRLRVDQNFLDKIASPAEKQYILSCPREEVRLQKAAALWAVKEAVFKALDLGGSKVVFKDVELYHSPSGKPLVRLYGVALEALQKLGGRGVEVSLSHSKTCAIGVAIVV